jgi:AraC family transcriptional regulator
MNPVAKALGFIESHFTGELTLGDISEIAGVSRFHMVRAFGMTTGYPVMRYVRGRRLTAVRAGYPESRARCRLQLA